MGNWRNWSHRLICYGSHKWCWAIYQRCYSRCQLMGWSYQWGWVLRSRRWSARLDLGCLKNIDRSNNRCSRWHSWLHWRCCRGCRWLDHWRSCWCRGYLRWNLLLWRWLPSRQKVKQWACSDKITNSTRICWSVLCSLCCSPLTADWCLQQYSLSLNQWILLKQKVDWVLSDGLHSLVLILIQSRKSHQ